MNEHASPIDPAAFERIEQLESMGARGVIVRVLSAYLSESPALAARIGAAGRDGDPADLFHAAHALKSSSANVGAMTLSHLCQEAETLGRSGTASDAGGVTAILAEFARVQEVLQARLVREQAGARKTK